MALKPDPRDPNYESEMKRYEKDPESWGPTGPARVLEQRPKDDDKKSKK